jgi:hypothetical protein
MKLLIVESPAKAKTISKYLDGKYEVKASVGHIRDLPKSNKKAIDIPGGFIPHYEISPGKEKVVAEIKSLVKIFLVFTNGLSPQNPFVEKFDNLLITLHLLSTISLSHISKLS